MASALAQNFSGGFEGISVPTVVGSDGNLLAKTWWPDCIIEFRHKNLTIFDISGFGWSIWKSNRLEFSLVGTLDYQTKEINLYKTYKGQYTHTVHYKCKLDEDNKVIWGKWKNGNVSLSYLFKPSPRLMSSLTYSPISREVRAKYVVKRLTAKWEGVSIKQASRTVWADCDFSFILNNAFDGVVSGRGVSLWKQHKIPFVVEGTFDLEQNAVTIVKEHISEQFSSKVEYSLHISFEDVSLMGSFRDGTLKLKRRADLNTFVPDGNEPDVVERVNNVYSEPSELPALSMSRQSSNESSVSNEEKKMVVNADDVPNDGVFSSSAIQQVPVAELEAMSLKNKILTSYKDFLAVILQGESEEEQKYKMLKAYRDTHKITDEIHNKAIEDLDLTGEVFEQIMKFKEQPKQENRDTCTVCMDAKIDCVLLPCGHLAVCKICSSQLNMCPLCREDIIQAKQIYFA